MSTVKNATTLKKTAMETVDDTGELKHSPSSRIKMLEEAISQYYIALKAETNSNTRLALSKNIGMASLRLAQALLENQVKDPRKVIYYVSECVRNLTLNWLWRLADKDPEWGSKIIGSINEAFDVAIQSFGKEIDSDWPKQLRHLDTVVKEIDPDSSLNLFRLRFYIKRAEFYNRSAAKTLELNNFILTDRILEYCRCDCQLARDNVSGSTSGDILPQLTEIEDMTKFLKASCESVKLRTAADDLLNSALNDAEEINFELIWDILDMYKAAAICATNEDIKNETIAIARQGMLFHKIFKLETYAKLYCRKAVELANILMVPGTSEKWYWECLKVIDEYQKKQREEEERKKAEERGPYLEQLVEDIKELKLNEHDAFKLLKHIYAKHPPKTDVKFKYDEKQSTPDTIRKVLIKAIFHYHPDKQVSFDKKWQVLCEEITKRLNVKYETMKGDI